MIHALRGISLHRRFLEISDQVRGIRFDHLLLFDQFFIKAFEPDMPAIRDFTATSNPRLHIVVLVCFIVLSCGCFDVEQAPLVQVETADAPTLAFSLHDDPAWPHTEDALATFDICSLPVLGNDQRACELVQTLLRDSGELSANGRIGNCEAVYNETTTVWHVKGTIIRANRRAAEAGSLSPDDRFQGIVFVSPDARWCGRELQRNGRVVFLDKRTATAAEAINRQRHAAITLALKSQPFD